MRAQISLFIILAIVILLVGGVAYYASDRGQLASQANTRGSLQGLADDCLQSVLTPGVYLLASQGGYIFSHTAVFEIETQQMAIQLSNSRITGPSKAQAEKELARYVTLAFSECMQNSSARVTDSQAKVDIGENSVLATLSSRVEKKTGDVTETITRVAAEVPLSLGHLLSIRDDLTRILQNSPDIPLGKFSSYGARVEVLPYDGTITVYSLFAEKKKNLPPLLLNFAVELLANQAPVLQPVRITLRRGEQQVIFLNATDPERQPLRYSTRDKVGLLDAVAGKLAINTDFLGNITTDACATDSAGQRGCASLSIEVVP